MYNVDILTNVLNQKTQHQSVVSDDIRNKIVKHGNELIQSMPKDKFIVHNYEKIR